MMTCSLFGTYAEAGRWTESVTRHTSRKRANSTRTMAGMGGPTYIEGYKYQSSEKWGFLQNRPLNI